VNAAAERILAMLSQRGQTLACAESCTGGRIAAALTAIPGSSAVFLGAVVAYSNAAKQALLGVAEATLGAHGAVAAPTAVEMAQGARQAFGADWAVSTTGIAGPGGATAEKPLGLVYIAVAGPDSAAATEYQFSGPREQVQRQAVDAALELLLAAVQRGA
jgi:PncC family amidohydrolase